MTSTASRSNRPCSAQRMQGLAVYRNLLRREPMPLPLHPHLRRSSQNISICYLKAFLGRPQTLQ